MYILIIDACREDIFLTNKLCCVCSAGRGAGPLRKEEAERRRQEALEQHEYLLKHVQHHTIATIGDEGLDSMTSIAYARRVLWFPYDADDDEDSGHQVPQSDIHHKIDILYLREDYHIVPHGQVWEASITMARWICTEYRNVFLCKTQVPLFLELGSGCGLPALILAALGFQVGKWLTSIFACSANIQQVVLSDRADGTIANLMHNVQVNIKNLKSKATCILL